MKKRGRNLSKLVRVLDYLSKDILMPLQYKRYTIFNSE